MSEENYITSSEWLWYEMNSKAVDCFLTAGGQSTSFIRASCAYSFLKRQIEDVATYPWDRETQDCQHTENRIVSEEYIRCGHVHFYALSQQYKVVKLAHGMHAIRVPDSLTDFKTGEHCKNYTGLVRLACPANPA